MPQPIGSVYLDQPRQARHRPGPTRTRRSKLAGHLTFMGIAGLTIAAALIGVRSVAATPDPLAEGLVASLDDEEARAEVESELAYAITSSLLTPELLDTADQFGIDHEEAIASWVTTAVADPEFAEVLTDIVEEIHGRMFEQAEPEPVDAGPLTDVVLRAASQAAPELEPFLPATGQVIEIEPGDVPDLTLLMRFIDRVILAGLACGGALVLALAVHDRRHRVLSSVARWLLVGGALLALAAFGLPWIAGRVTGWVTVEIAVRSTAARLLAPAAVAGVLGVALATIAGLWRRREKRRIAAEGAAAWLEVVEPEPWVEPPRDVELARRGLVDGSRHLTSI